ncbi:MAG: SHOCT domain-containing protein [Candidatus Limnocylindrales bacterium]
MGRPLDDANDAIEADLERLRDLEDELRGLTSDWTADSVVRTFARDDAGVDDYEDEATVLGAHAYRPSTQSEDPGHIHIGRLLLTSGLSVLAGRRGIRSDGSLTVVFSKTTDGLASQPGAPSVSDDLATIERLGRLRDAGLLTTEEFERKKAELLDRL